MKARIITLPEKVEEQEIAIYDSGILIFDKRIFVESTGNSKIDACNKMRLTEKFKQWNDSLWAIPFELPKKK